MAFWPLPVRRDQEAGSAQLLGGNGAWRLSMWPSGQMVVEPVTLPFFYPSIGVSLAPVGCFEVALAAPSPNEPKGPGGCRARQYQHGITVAGSFLSFRGSGEPSYCAGPTAAANSPEGVFIS